MWKYGLITLAGICVVFLIILGMFFWRLRAIGSRVGSFECALLEGGRWRAGIASYSQRYLNWHKVASLSAAPNRRFLRQEFQILGRDVTSAEGGIVGVNGAHCLYEGKPIRIAADQGALDGLVSWLEASPPRPLT